MLYCTVLYLFVGIAENGRCTKQSKGRKKSRARKRDYGTPPPALNLFLGGNWGWIHKSEKNPKDEDGKALLLIGWTCVLACLLAFEAKKTENKLYIVRRAVDGLFLDMVG